MEWTLETRESGGSEEFIYCVRVTNGTFRFLSRGTLHMSALDAKPAIVNSLKGRFVFKVDFGLLTLGALGSGCARECVIIGET